MNIAFCRNGKIFYVSTTTSFSSVTTATYCYVPSAVATPLLTCKKKRRSLWQSALPAGKGIAPSSSRHSSDEDMPIVEDPNENIGSGVRDGKFANYWITTTVISTVTTFRFECWYIKSVKNTNIFTIYIKLSALLPHSAASCAAPMDGRTNSAGRRNKRKILLHVNVIFVSLLIFRGK